MIREIDYIIDEANAGKTVYVFLRERYFSAKMLSHLKHTENSVILNGNPVFLNTVMRVKDELHIVYEEHDESLNIVPVELPFEIVYEDEDIMVIDKPADMPVHPAINNFDNTLANGIAYYFARQGKSFMFRCINRLDRDTSGLLIVAKHRLSASILSYFMKNRMIRREYLALASGVFENESGTIDLPIGRVSDSIIERFVDFENGERAVTHYEVVRTYVNQTPDNVSDNISMAASAGSKFDNDSMPGDCPCTLLRLHLETGRTHQIRVHLSHVGHPLLGDHMYNKEPGSMPRQALHSHSLKFMHPITLETLEFVSPAPFVQNH